MDPDSLQNNLGKWLWPLATAMIAWGGYPAPPLAFVMLTRHELVRYALLYILIWQGGAQQDFKTALIATAIIYFVTKILEVRQMISDLNIHSTYAMQPPAQSMVEPPITAEVSSEQAETFYGLAF